MAKHVRILERRLLEIRARDEALAAALSAFKRKKEQKAAANQGDANRKTSTVKDSTRRQTKRGVTIQAQSIAEEGEAYLENGLPGIAENNTSQERQEEKRQATRRLSRSNLELMSPSFNSKRLARNMSAKGGGLKESLRDQVQSMSLQAMRRLCETPLEERTPDTVEKLCILLQQLTPLFKETERSTMEEVCRVMKVIEYQAYSAIHHQFDPSTQFYIVLRGKLEVKISHGNTLKAVNEMGRGDYFGEIGLLKDMKRSATVTARTRVELLVFEKDDFDRLLKPIFDLTRIRRVEFLHSIYSFRNMACDELEKVATFFRLRECEDKAVINAEEEDRLYFIIEGECQLKHAQAGELPIVALETGNPELDVPSFYEGKTISRLGAGEFFGEGAVFPRMRRNWLVEAHGAVKLYYITRIDLAAHVAQPIWRALEEEAAFRLDYFDGRLAGKKQSYSDRSGRPTQPHARIEVLEPALSVDLTALGPDLAVEMEEPLDAAQSKARGDEAALKRDEALAALKSGVTSKLRELEERRKARSPPETGPNSRAASHSSLGLEFESSQMSYPYSLSAPSSPMGRKAVHAWKDEDLQPAWSRDSSESPTSISASSPKAANSSRFRSPATSRPATTSPTSRVHSLATSMSGDESVTVATPRRHSTTAQYVPLRTESALVRRLKAEYRL